MTDKDLLAMARKAREYAYAPYSGFQVGAALLDKQGRVFTGCNVENSSYGLTICAERVAICKAVSEGSRDYVRLAVVSDQGLTWPCGACRQFLAEFAPEITVISSDAAGEMQSFSLGELLPYRFDWRPAGGRHGN